MALRHVELFQSSILTVDIISYYDRYKYGDQT